MNLTETFDIPLGIKVMRVKALWEGHALARIWLGLVERPEHKGTSPLAAHLMDLLANRAVRIGLPVAARGTAFQHAVWDAASRIPYGQTRTYGEIAGEIGCKSPRAVGQALGANPLPLVIPCHRVVGRGGRLAGFSAGVEIKALLLEHERRRYENVK